MKFTIDFSFLYGIPVSEVSVVSNASSGLNLMQGHDSDEINVDHNMNPMIGIFFNFFLGGELKVLTGKLSGSNRIIN